MRSSRRLDRPDAPLLDLQCIGEPLCPPSALEVSRSLACGHSRCSHKGNRNRQTHSVEQVVGQTGERALETFGRPPATHP